MEVNLKPGSKYTSTRTTYANMTHEKNNINQLINQLISTFL